MSENTNNTPGEIAGYTTASARSELTGLGKIVAVFLCLWFAIRGSLVEAFKIPSESMVPTLQEGDFILVNKLSYGFRLPGINETVYQYDLPKRGDVVVFTRPDIKGTKTDESKTNIIKRVIGLPGDTVEVKGSSLFINDELVEEDYAKWTEGGLRDFLPETVPDNKVFLLGDNRDHSKDSRFWEDSHFLDIERIKGKAFLIYWSHHSTKRIFKRIE